MWLFDLFGLDPDSGFNFETDSQKNETSLKWILWIRISETALNTFLFSFRFETESKRNQVKLNLVSDSVNLVSDSVNLVSDSVNLGSDSVTNRT